MKANGRVAVDSNAVIAYRAGVPEVCRLIDGAESIFMPVTVLGELLYGAMKSGRPAENEAAARTFWSQCVPVYTDETVAFRYAAVRLALALKGRPIPENDTWIAAACMEVDALLISKDDHFKAVDGLDVVGWE